MELIGSHARDFYRYEHKQLKNYSSEEHWKKCHACDIDLMEIRDGKIIAFTDFKLDGDILTTTEKKAYRQLRKIAPVFIIKSKYSNLEEMEVYSFPNKVFSEKYLTKEHFFHGFIERIEECVRKYYEAYGRGSSV